VCEKNDHVTALTEARPGSHPIRSLAHPGPTPGLYEARTCVEDNKNINTLLKVSNDDKASVDFSKPCYSLR